MNFGICFDRNIKESSKQLLPLLRWMGFTAGLYVEWIDISKRKLLRYGVCILSVTRSPLATEKFRCYYNIVEFINKMKEKRHVSARKRI